MTKGEARMTKRRSCLAVGLLGAALVGCQPSAPPQVNGGKPLPEYNPDANGGGLEAALDDPVSGRMQDIVYVMLSYIANHQDQLPDTLEQLREVPGQGPTLNLVCPGTNEEFKYSRAGMYAGKDPRRLIMWEPTPSHSQGKARACVFIPRIEPGAAVIPEVRIIPEEEFQKAAPAIQ